ncbi:MAG: RNA-binding protein [Nitrosarchaeum sp.]|jgi:ribosomal RNA assembly protein|nr:RNA-binding protein [Nitrosarchaeum sp.]MBP0119619.1 RNA-binding protein [Nitrosarchaeum sp.]MBP0134298.1 RNA-binding protein [Nitrosarchaeum sp.]MDW7641028.1 KH domain-containing protein [Nitrosarchaeum sp.]MSV27073.1 RNA-binding protein [Nitrosarchaeum sp.]
MSFEKILRIPNERIAVLIGKSGNVKSKIEQLCYVTLDIDGENGEVFIKSHGNVENIQPFKAMEIVTAIGRGFSPENAMNLLDGDNALHVIDLREFAGKSNANIERIKGRIIGEGGKARKNMENLTGTHISVYGKTVSIIGDTSKLRLVVDAISSISNGSIHGAVYNKLEAANRKNKQEKMQLWENQDVFY